MRRFVVSWLGIALLAFNLLAGTAMAARAAEQGPALFTQDLLGDRIVVCTAAGMVVLDREGHPVAPPAGQSHFDFCAFCVPMMHGGLQTPVATTVVVAPLAQSQPETQPESLVAEPKPARLSGAASPRAPPLA